MTPTTSGDLPRRLARRAQQARVRLAHALDPHARSAFSQEGEDLILARRFEDRTTGFYVDVGAHHPSRFSNTRLLYEQGWSGINLDPLPGSMTVFARRRPRDLNLEMGVGSSPGTGEYHQFQEPALNTFDQRIAALRITEGWAPVGRRVVPVVRLADVLDEHAPGRHIDFLNVDVEGRELEVLLGLDLSRHRPEVMCVESLKGAAAGPAQLLLEQGYVEWARTGNSVLLADGRASANGDQ